MDIEEFLNTGVTVKNPNYVKGTKKKPSTTPKFIQSGNYDDAIDRDSRIGTMLSQDSYDLTSLGNDENHYADYGVNLNPVNTRDELNQARAKNQSAWEQTGRSLSQMGLNEVVIGTALGLSNLVDMAANVGKESGQDDYTNPFSTLLEEKQDQVKKAFEIYRENPNDSWQVGDFGWWADNAISVASTLSMLIPSMATTKGLGALSKVGKLEKVSMGIAKAAKEIGITKNAATLSKAINSGAEIGTSALLSRTMEGYLEARGVYKETYDKSLDRLKTMSPDEKDKLFKNNPDFVGQPDEEIAKRMSSLSADETFKNDYAMLLFDIAQFKALGSMWKGVVNKEVNAGLRAANRSAIAGLADDGAAAATKLGFIGKHTDAIKHALKNPMTSLAAVEFSEGLEEGYQGMQTEKGKEVAEKMLDPNFNARTLGSYLTDGAIWEQAFWGILGGVGFQAAGTALGNASKAVKGKINKATMTDQEYALSQMTDEKIREQEINSRKTRMQSYVESMQLLNSGKNPFDFKLDPVTKQPLLEEGSQVNQDVNSEEADQLKSRLTNEFVTNMVLDATDKGNYDLFKDYISDNNFNKFFQEAGLENNAGDKNFSNMITAKMDDVHEQYTGALYDVLNSIDVENENIAKIVARNIARRKLEVNDLRNTSGDLYTQIANDPDNNDYDAYEENERLKYVDDQLNEIYAKETEIQNLLDTKRISPQAAAEIAKENNIRRNQLLAFGSTNNWFGNEEVVKNILSNNIEDINANDFIDEFNKYLTNNNINLSNQTAGAPKKSIQDLIKKKITLDDHISYIESTLPSTQSGYQREYDDIARNADRLTVERYNKATDIIGEYLESHDNLDEARENIMTNNVPADIKKQLDILKLGHHSTQKYTSQINAILREISNDRDAATEEAKNVTVDNTTSNNNTAQNEKVDVEVATTETDNREADTNDSSTGKVQQSPPAAPEDYNIVDPEPVNNNPAPVFDIDVEINNLEKDADVIEKQRAEEFIVDNDARAVGLASSITFNLFKTSRNLFDNLEGKDVNSAEFNNIVDIVSEELFVQGVSRGYVNQASVDGVRMALSMIHRRLSSKGIKNADMFKELADQLATKHRVEVGDTISNSTTKLIPDGEFNGVIDAFIDSYIQNRGVYTLKGSKTVINVEDLFKELLNNDGISFAQAKHIFFNIADYIASPNNSKYIFTNKTELNKNLKTPSSFFSNLINNKSTVEIVDTYMHIAAPSKVTDGYNKAVNEAVSGEDVTIGYYEGENGSSTNSISIKRNGVEIGYLGSVQPNATNTGYSLKRQNQGFVYNLTDNNGLIESNLDKLFIPLINKEDQQYSDLMDIAYKQFAYEMAIKNNATSSDITNEDIDSVLNSPVIRGAISRGEIKIPDYKKTNKQKAQYILNSINNILFYDSSAITTPMILESYSYWKSNTFSNYTNTHKIQTALNTNKKITTKLVNVAAGKLLIDAANHDVNSRGFTYEQNPIMIVDANGNIINERGNTSYSNVAGFEAGSMGMLIADNPNAPIMALFTESNKLSSNKDLANRTYNEITDLLSNFQNKELSFDNLGTALGNLFSGPNIKSNNLFSGYSVIRTSDKIALNLQGQKGVYSLIIHKFEKASNKEGTGITHIPNGVRSNAKSSVSNNKTFNNNIAKEIVSNLSFNKTFYAVNNKNVDNEKSNLYLYKENGKLIIEIGGKKDTYNNFGHFVLSTNAFKTNQGVNSEGGYFDNTDKIKSLFINTAIINSPVEGGSSTDSSDTATNIIKTATKTKSVNTSQVLTAAGVAGDIVGVLTGTNQFGIELIPKESYFDSVATKAEAYYTKGKMFFTNRGANAISKSPNNLIRLLIHENLHAKFDEQGLFQQAGIVDDLMNTYNVFINDLNSVGAADVRYKEASSIKKWVEDNKFNPIDYFSTLSVEQQRVWEKRSDDERNRQFAEEWLVESLTQPAIIRYLNNAIYDGNDISVEGIDNNAKTIWQKIIDVLLKLFGRNSGNIKNNTILAQQYSILGNRNEVTTATETVSDLSIPGESPLDNNTTVIETESIDDKDISVTGFQTEGRKLNEESDIDDLDFAVTTLIEDADEVKIAAYRDNSDINMNGIQVVPDMNKYINQFAEQDKPIIARMMAANELKFRCE